MTRRKKNTREIALLEACVGAGSPPRRPDDEEKGHTASGGGDAAARDSEGEANDEGAREDAAAEAFVSEPKRLRFLEPAPPGRNRPAEGTVSCGGDAAGAKRRGRPPSTKRPRLEWTPELHHRFVVAVSFRGIEHSEPKNIVHMMNVEGLTRQHVASHLQKYRQYFREHGPHARPEGMPLGSLSPDPASLLRDFEKVRPEALPVRSPPPPADSVGPCVARRGAPPPAADPALTHTQPRGHPGTPSTSPQQQHAGMMPMPMPMPMMPYHPMVPAGSLPQYNQVPPFQPFYAPAAPYHPVTPYHAMPPTAPPAAAVPDEAAPPGPVWKTARPPERGDAGHGTHHHHH